MQRALAPFFALALSLGILAIAAGCDRPETAPVPAEPAEMQAADEDPRPDIVLIVICSLRRNHLGFAGYDRPTSPFIDSLVASGTSFDNATAAASWTKPSTSSILTGLTPNVHGLTDYYTAPEIRGLGFSPKRVLAQEIETLPEVLKAAGYATLGRNNNIHAGPAFNLDQGFDDTKDIGSEYRAPKMLRDLDRFLGRLDSDEPFFFFLLSRDAHVAYKPLYEWYRRFARKPVIPEPGFMQYAVELHTRLKGMSKAEEEIPDGLKRQFIDLYDAELAQLDAALSELPSILARHGRKERTVVLLTADHGERFFDPHGAISHGGGFMEQHLVHIPLVMHGAGIPQGKRVPDVVRSIDILPTLAELARTEAPAVAQGRSLLPFLDEEEKPSQMSAFSSHHAKWHAVRWGRHKLHRDDAGVDTLYDLEDDPEELAERSTEAPERLVQLQGELEHWLAQEAALSEFVTAGETKELSPEEIESLRELGYVE